LFAAFVGHLINDAIPAGHPHAPGRQHLIRFEAVQNGVDAAFAEIECLVGSGTNCLD
jgi:hypothetical protein